MSPTAAGIVFLLSLIVALAAVHVPLGDYMFRVYTSEKHSRAERNSAMTDLLTSRLLISVSVHRLPQRGLCCFRLGLPWEPAVGMGER